MAYKDLDDTTANRSAADGDAMRSRDNRNTFEEARNRTRDDLGDGRRTVEDENAAPSEAASSEVARTNAAGNGGEANYAANRPADAHPKIAGAGLSSMADDVAESRTGVVAPAATRPDVAAGGAGTANLLAPDVAGDTAKGLLPSDSLSEFQSRWQEIQIGFVDEPQTAVRDAEALVNDVVTQLTKLFTQERQNLEQNWNRGTEASTEDLRVTLQRYRSFFQRLLAA